MIEYFAEQFEKSERTILQKHMSNVDDPVFVLKGLPQTTSAALFARYSRTPKSLRRLFLDEFIDFGENLSDLDLDDNVGLDHANDLFGRVLADYGDDSVAQLASVHIACEQVSQILAKQIEWGRLGAYLEQSTRYIPYTDKRDGKYRYIRDTSVLDSTIGERYTLAMDGLFDTYSALIPRVRDHLDRSLPSETDTKARAQAIRALSLDLLRGLLPAGTVSNIGMCASPQAFEQLIYRLRSSTLPEAKQYAVLLAAELQKVIPSFLTRLDREDRGGVWVEYLEKQHEAQREAYMNLMGNNTLLPPQGLSVELLDWNKDAEDDILAASLFSIGPLSYATVRSIVRELTPQAKDDLFAQLVGDRRNRRHRPGRGFEHAWYTFEVVSDYGAFRDLQRHRMLTIQWQPLTPSLGYTIPPEIEEMGNDVRQEWITAVSRAEEAYSLLYGAGFIDQAQYCVTLGHHVRYLMEINAREAMHMLELRTSPQGHASYRKVCQEMHHLIRDEAGHTRLAAAMQFVGMKDVYLPRYDTEHRHQGSLVDQT